MAMKLIHARLLQLGTALALTLPLWGGGPLLAGCQAPARTGNDTVRFTHAARREGLPAVMVLAPPDEKLVPVVQQLQNELEEEFDVLVTAVGTREDSVDVIARAMQRERPQAVVLLNNSTANVYRKWARHSPAPPVSVILMASFAEELQRSIPNSVGIAYEVPAVTSFVGLRALGRPVNTVGVVHRKALGRYVRAQERLAQAESISFVLEELDEGFEMRHLKAALVRLKRAGVDVLWLPNDNGLLSRQLVAKAWLPYLDRLELPVIVGVPSLVRADYAFGVYGAIPDPEALAIQAADLIFDLSASDWVVEGQRVRQPLSAKTYVSAPLGRKFGVLAARLHTVDVVVGRLPEED